MRFSGFSGTPGRLVEALGGDRRAALIVSVCVTGYLAGMLLCFFPAEYQFHKYPQSAELFLAGTFPGERLLDLSPLYFYLHLLARKIAPVGWQGVVWLQLAAAGAASGLLFLLLRRRFPLGLALAGVTAFALSRSVASYACLLEPEMFLLLALLATLWFAVSTGRWQGLAAGCTLAAAVLLRPTVLPLVLALPCYYRIQLGRHAWQRPALLLATPVLAVLLLLSVRNATVTGVLSPLVMNPGYVFFEGNNPLSSGQSSVYPPLVGELKTELAGDPDNPHQTYRLLARRDTAVELSVAEVNRLWAGRALHYIADYPGRWFGLLATKVYFLLHDFRRYDLIGAFNFDQALNSSWVPTIPLALLVSLALPGLVARAKCWREDFLWLAVLSLQGAAMLVFYVSDRQRLVILPVMIYFSGFGLNWLLTCRRRALWSGGAIVAVMLVLLTPNGLMRDNLHLWAGYQRSDEHWLAAAQARQAGDATRAAQAAVQSLAAAPWLEDYARPAYLSFAPEGFAARALQLVPEDERNPSRLFDRGVLALAAGELEVAERIFRGLQEDGGVFDRGYLQSSLPNYYLARIAVLRGMPSAAETLLLAALNDAPGEPFVLGLLFALTEEREWHQRLLRYFGESEALFQEGRAFLFCGKAEQAVSRLEAFVRLLPELRRGAIYLAAAKGRAGQLVEAAELYQHSTASRKDPVLLEEPILDLFRELLRQRPDDFSAHFQAGRVFAEFGHVEAASGAWRRARQLASDERSVRLLERELLHPGAGR